MEEVLETREDGQRGDKGERERKKECTFRFGVIT